MGLGKLMCYKPKPLLQWILKFSSYVSVSNFINHEAHCKNSFLDLKKMAIEIWKDQFSSQNGKFIF